MLLMFCLGGSVLTGCATVSPNPWTPLDADTSETTTCDPLPDKPIPDIQGDTFVYDGQGTAELDQYFILAEACEKIANAHAKQIDQLKQAASSLVEAGKAQRRVADLRAEIIAEERRKHWIEKAGLYAIIALGIGAASL